MVNTHSTTSKQQEAASSRGVDPHQEGSRSPAASADLRPDLDSTDRLLEFLRGNQTTMQQSQQQLMEKMDTTQRHIEMMLQLLLNQRQETPPGGAPHRTRVESPAPTRGRPGRRGPPPREPLLPNPPEEMRLDQGEDRPRPRPELIPIGARARARGMSPIGIDDGSDMEDDPIQNFQMRNQRVGEYPRRGYERDRDRNGDREGGNRGLTLRLKFSKFKDGDPLDWVYRAERFFHYHGTAEDQKVLISSFHLEETALRWFQTADRARPFNGWEDFSAAICRRFGPTEYDDFQSMLSRVTQKTTVRAFQEEFERISNRVVGWSDSALKSVYL